MAPLTATIKNVLAILLLAGAFASPATAATFTMKRGINLDNWITWPSENQWGDPSVILPFPEWRRTLGAEQLQVLKATGFDFVRMPIDPVPLISGVAAPLREQLFDGVLEAVRLINAAGLKVVVDMHTIPWGDDRSLSTGKLMDDPAIFNRYADMLRTMARTLSGEDPALVALEVINEPTADCEPGDRTWPDKLKRLFAAARASATRLTLVLQGSCWSNAEGLSRIDPSEFADDNLIWTFHSYSPFLLTHQGATWAGDFIPYVTGIPYPPASASKEEMDGILEAIRQRIRAEAPVLRRDGLLAYLDEQYAEIDTPEKLAAVMEKPFDTVGAWAKEHGIASEDILLGEFGMIRQEYGNSSVMKPEWRAAYVKDMIGLAEKHGFAWSIWSYGGAFGVVEEFENRPAEAEVMETVKALEGRR
jgi:hypothetical protein